MSKVPQQPPAEQLEPYEKLVAVLGVERKGANMPYTSLNGNMFSFLGESGVGIRLPEAAREEFTTRFETTLYKAHGAVLKEYVAVPNKLLNDTAQLVPYMKASYEYAKTLKPKPTKNK